MEKNNALAGVAIVSLLVGGAVGYYMGMQAGGQTAAVDSSAAEEEALAEEIADAANPFKVETENPVDTGYVNPFKSSANPFAQ